jgi:hypothetical protein
MTAALPFKSHRFVFGNFPKQTWHEESLAYVANDNDEITRGTLSRVTKIWFGKLYKKIHGHGIVIAEKFWPMWRIIVKKLTSATLIRVIQVWFGKLPK